MNLRPLHRLLIVLPVVAAMLSLFPRSVLALGFTVSGATVTLMSGAVVQTDGDVVVTNGELDGGGAALQVGGDWTMPTGAFVANGSTVTFQGAAGSTSTISGSNTFYSLRSVTPGKGMIFPAGSTQTVQGTLLLAGTAANRLRVRSTAPGMYAYLVNQTTNVVQDVDAADNDASGGLTIRASSNSIYTGSTMNWTFGAPDVSLTAINVSSFTLGWNSLANVLGYLVQTSTSPTFLGTLVSTQTALATTAVTVTGLSPDTTYYVRLGALFPGATEWAAVNATPTATLTDPILGGHVSQIFVTSVTANWNALTLAQGYTLQASTSSDFAQVLVTSNTFGLQGTTLTLSGLAAHTTYYLRVGGLNWDLLPNLLNLGPIVTQAGGPPLGPTIVFIDSTSVDLDWTTAPFASGYVVQASTSALFSGPDVSSVTNDVTDTSLGLEGLVPDTSYFLRVGALYNGATTYTSTLSTATLTADLVSGQITQVFTSSVAVHWIPLSTANGYRVEASTAVDFSGVLYTSATTDVNLSTLAVQGLTAALSYYFRVGGLNLDNVLNPAPIGEATPGAGVGPSNPVIVRVQDDSLTVSWGTAAGADGYEMDVSTASAFSGVIESSITAQPTPLNLTVLGLVPDTTYYVRVGALYNSASSYALTTPLSTSTLASPLTDAHVQQTFATSIQVAWTPSTAQGYIVYASTANDDGGTVHSSATADGQLGTLTVPGLAPGTTYFLRVDALNWNGAASPESAGTGVTQPGSAPNGPTISAVYVTSMTMIWGAIAGAGGYIVDLSQASDFSSLIFSSATSDGSMFTLTVTGLSASTQYYARVASLWNGARNYATTTPAFGITGAAPVSSAPPERPETVRGALTSGNTSFTLTWRAVAKDIHNKPTTIASYTVLRSTALFGTYTTVASVTSGLAYSESRPVDLSYYRVAAIDTNGASSTLSDAVDSSPDTNRYVTPDGGGGTVLTIPDASNAQLQSNPDGSQDIEIVLTRRTQDDSAVVLRSWEVGAYRISDGAFLQTFSFVTPGYTLSLDYSAALSPAVAQVAPYWMANGQPVRLKGPVQPSVTPLSVTVQNTGVYQVRSESLGSAGFSLLPGSPYPRLLTPNRPNENRRLFFLYSNPDSDPVSVSIYDVRDRKVRDLDPNMVSPIPGSLYWDCKDDSGRIVHSGIYLYKIQAGKKTLTGSVVVAQ